MMLCCLWTNAWDETPHGILAYATPGVVGVLMEAKHQGLIQAIQPHLDALRDLAGFRVSEALYQRVL
jgi:predicted nucleic acid-binding protein